MNDTLPAPVEGKLSRWLNLDELSFSARYRNTFNTDGHRVFEDGQERSVIKGQFKFDKEGKYFIGFRVSSGTYFNWAYANFAGSDYASNVLGNIRFETPQTLQKINPTLIADPLGSLVLSHIAANGWKMSVRDLYASVTPVSFFTFEYGGIGIERGAGSEITTFDDDGFLSGGRIRLKAPKALYFDQLTATVAYFGDVFEPNLFNRGERFKQVDYRQFLAEKHFGSRAHASVDYTSQLGTHTMREALRVKFPEVHVVDSVRGELYQRLNGKQFGGYFARSGSGWALVANKRFRKAVAVEGGYADIDPDDGVYSGSSLLTAAGFSLNGDAYQIGKRFFGRISYQPTSYLNLFSFYTHEVDAQRNPAYFGFNRQGWTGGVTVNFKSILTEKAHLF